MAALSRGRHPRIAHVRYIKFKHDSEAFWSFFYIWFGPRVLKSLLGIARQWSREKFAILLLLPRHHVRILNISKVGY